MSAARFDTSDPAYRDLLSVVLRSEAAVVPFVGAGLSVYGEPGERLPLWGQLLQQLVAEGIHLGLIPETGDAKINDVLRRGRYIDAAEELLKALGEPTFRRVVERELDDAGKPVPPGIAELVAVNWALIVTTNLDRLIWRAYLDRHKRPPTTITGAEARRLTRAISETLIALDTTLAQIHGVLDVFESWRLTRAHYTQLLRDPAYMTALESLFLKRIFFIGYGLQDDDFDFVFKTVASIYPAGIGTFYALVPHSRKRDPALLNLVERGGFQPIFYEVDTEPDETDPFCGHRAVYECLSHLASEWVAEKVNLDVNLKYFPEPDPNMIERPEVELLAEHIAEGSTVTQVVGLGGLGKTSLVQQFLQEKRSEIVAAGYDYVFGCSFYRADIGLFIQDMALAIIGPEQRPLPQQAERICAHVRQHRMLLVLDGLEAILDAEASLLSPYVLQVLESVVAGGGAVVVTSRVVANGGILGKGKEVEIEPFSPAQILAFLRNWGLEELGDAANTRLAEITAGHPLALRILAGVLQDVPPAAAIATIEHSAVIDVTDEVDPLRENRLARIFGSYFHHLGESEIAFLDCLTAFERPAGFSLIESAFTRSYLDTAINRPLVDSDLRSTVALLLERRLLTVSPLGEISCHPTVREYFARHVSEGHESLAPIHRYLAHEILQGSPWQPDGFEEAMALVTACRHAGEGQNWELFDDLFRNRLMRGFRDHLCDTFGAWDEALRLAMIGSSSNLPAQLEIPPGYYPITAARCLKHLGRTAESRSRYVDALKHVASSHDPEAAMYVNNLMTLLVWRGELAGADWLVELNIRALAWIDEPWKHRWQVEHGFSSFAYLKLLQGNLATAERLFIHSEQAWGDLVGERPWPQINDYYALHRSELALLLDPKAHIQVISTLNDLISAEDAVEWPEALCRGLLQVASVHTDLGTREGDRGEIEKAEARLEQTRATTAGMNVADTAVSYHLARLKVELARHTIGAEANLGRVELKDLVDRISTLVSTSGLNLVMPEVTAAWGALAYLDGSLDRAAQLHDRALRQGQQQGNSTASISPRYLPGWLGERLGRTVALKPTGSTVELVGLVGSELSTEWMVERLETMPMSS